MNEPTSTWSWSDRRQLSVLLVWSCLLVLPIGRAVEVPVMLMAIAGVYLSFRHWRTWRQLPAFRLYCTVFLLAWIPILVSLVDAVNVEKAARLSVNHLRFAFGGLFILHAMATADAHRRFLALCAWLLWFWIVDGIVQIGFGRDLFGFSPPSVMTGVHRINALFGEEGLVYGTALSVFCPLLWEYARRNWALWPTLAVVAISVAVILLTGTRSAWINVFVLLLAYAVLLWIRHGRLSLRVSVAALAAVALVLTALWFGSGQFSASVQRAAGTLTGSTEALKSAVGHRIWIAKGAANMIRANPVNGVGAGGFRYAFADYAAANDPFVEADPPIIPYHSHHVWLDTLSETGVIGAAGLAALLVLLVVAGARAPRNTRRCMLPYALCLLVAYFPINSHMAIYSSFWSQIVWWLIALYCAAYGAGLAAAPEERALPQ